MNAHKIVVGYDGSDSSKVAVEYALRTAAGRGGSVLIAHVAFAGISSVGATPVVATSSHDALMVSERKLLDDAVRDAAAEAPGVDVQSTIVVGRPAPALLGLLDDADLLVLGSRGLGAFAELMVGSTSVQLAGHAPCPVVVVRPTGYLPLGSEVGQVVVGVDGSTGSAAALAYAFEEASWRGCGLTAIAAWEVPAFEAYGWMSAPPPKDVLPVYEREARRTLAESLAGWSEKYPEVEVRRRSVHASPLAALVNASAGARLVVVGSRGSGGFRSLLLGSVGHSLLHHAHCPVALVPRAEGAPVGEQS
jgi:nucleotide-binding universal stress UspA family protein